MSYFRPTIPTIPASYAEFANLVAERRRAATDGIRGEIHRLTGDDYSDLSDEEAFGFYLFLVG